MGAAWHLAQIEVEDCSDGHKYIFPCGQWLSTSVEDKQICRELSCANLPTPRKTDKLCTFVMCHVFSVKVLLQFSLSVLCVVETMLCLTIMTV